MMTVEDVKAILDGERPILVVRCKDCIYATWSDGYACSHPEICHLCEPTDFCSYGERRTVPTTPRYAALSADEVASAEEIATTVDAVPVVRCGKCKYGIMWDGKLSCEWHGFYSTENDWFCGDGKRREDGADDDPQLPKRCDKYNRLFWLEGYKVRTIMVGIEDYPLEWIVCRECIDGERKDGVEGV